MLRRSTSVPQVFHKSYVNSHWYKFRAGRVLRSLACVFTSATNRRHCECCSLKSVLTRVKQLKKKFFLTIFLKPTGLGVWGDRPIPAPQRTKRSYEFTDFGEQAFGAAYATQACKETAVAKRHDARAAGQRGGPECAAPCRHVGQ